MKKAILIDSVNKTVTYVQVGEGIEDIYKHLNCDLFDVVRLGGGIDCYIDDEGLLKEGYIDEDETKHNLTGFTFPGFRQPIMGNGLIMGCNEEGESVSTRATIEQVTEFLTFVEYDNQKDKPEPKIEITSW